MHRSSKTKSKSSWPIRQSIKKRIDGFYRSDCCVVDIKKDEWGVYGTVVLRNSAGLAKRLYVTAKVSSSDVCEFATLWVKVPASWADGAPVAKLFLSRVALEDFLAAS